VQGVADVLSSIASSLSVSDNQDSSTPQRRTRAIKMVSVDESLSKEECVKAMRLFRKDIASADTYLAIDEKGLWTAYIHDELADFS
jgi:tellurite resistance protein